MLLKQEGTWAPFDFHLSSISSWVYFLQSPVLSIGEAHGRDRGSHSMGVTTLHPETLILPTSHCLFRVLLEQSGHTGP